MYPGKHEGPAIQAANDAPFGLAPCLYSQEVCNIAPCGAGAGGAISSEAVPFSGVKESGFDCEPSTYDRDDPLSIKSLRQCDLTRGHSGGP